MASSEQGKNSNGENSGVVDGEGSDAAHSDSLHSDVGPGDADFSRLNELEGSSAKISDPLAEMKEKYLRALAELENYKKRALKERADLLKYQGERILQDMLPVVDNLELALQHADAEPDKLRSGMQLIHKLFVDTLNRWGVTSESSVGKPFDPIKHSALSRVPSVDSKPGTVVNELRRAYHYKDKLLRPAEVVVAAEQSGGSPSSEPTGDTSGVN